MYSIAASRGPPSFTTKQLPKDVDSHPSVDLESQHLEGNDAASTSSSSLFMSSSSTSLEAILNVEEESELTASSKYEDSSDFLFGNKGVIDYDNAPENRCKHTTVQPSKMMALAMELQVSNRGKASRMFRTGKMKAQESLEEDENEEEESKLAQLWVVPDADQTSRGNTPSTATHLQPSLVNADFVIQGTATPDLQNNVWNEPSLNEEMQEEDLALIADISVSELVGNADCKDFDNFSATEESYDNAQSRIIENDESCDIEFEDSSFEQQLKTNDNENQIKQEMTKVTIESKILSLDKENLSSNTKDETFFCDNNNSKANHLIETPQLEKPNQAKMTSELSAISITSVEVKSTLNGNYGDCNVLEPAVEIAGSSGVLLTTDTNPGGQNDYECKSVVNNVQGKDREHSSCINETLLNDINRCDNNNESIVCESYSKQSLEFFDSTKTTDDNNNVITTEKSQIKESESNRSRTGMINNNQEATPKVNVVPIASRVSPKKSHEKYPYKDRKDEVAKSHILDLVVSDSTLSSLSSSLVSVTSMESLSSSDTSRSVLSSCVSVTSPNANSNIASPGTSSSFETPNYFEQGDTHARDSNQMQTDQMSNNKEMRESRPSSINSTSHCASIELEPSPLCEIAEGKISYASEHNATLAANNDSVDKSDCGGRPRPCAGPTCDVSSNQHEDSSVHAISSKVTYEISQSEKILLEKQLLHQPEPSKAAFKSEITLTVDSSSLTLEGKTACLDCNNEMAFCCCRRQKNSDIASFNQDRKSSKRLVQSGQDPIVESLRESEKQKLSFGSLSDENELTKIETHCTDSYEKDRKSNVDLTGNTMKIGNGNKNNGTFTQSNRTEATILETIISNEKNSILYANKNESLDEFAESESKKIVNDYLISCEAATEQNQEFFDRKDAVGTRVVNTNPNVTVCNDSSGSKISLKVNERPLTAATTHDLSSVNETRMKKESFVGIEKSINDERKAVITNEAITSLTAISLQAETTAETGQLLSKEKQANDIKHPATVSFADMPSEEVLKPQDGSHSTSLTNSSASVKAVDDYLNSSEEKESLVKGENKKAYSSSVEVIKSPSGNCILTASANRRRQAIVRTSSSVSTSSRTTSPAVTRRLGNERFAARKAKYQNLIKASSVQNMTPVEVDSSKPSKHNIGATTSKPVFSSNVFVSIGARRQKFNREQATAPAARNSDNSWRFKQQNSSQNDTPIRRSPSVKPSTTVRPQQQNVCRQWSNPATPPPSTESKVTPRVQSQLQSSRVRSQHQQDSTRESSRDESTRQDTPVPNEDAPLKRTSSSVTSIRTMSPVKPPRSVRNRITSGGRHEIGSMRQTSFGTRNRSHVQLNKKEMSRVGNGSLIRANTESSISYARKVQENDERVVDAPSLTVKEIRARYKSRDYENFAVPKAKTGSSSRSSRKGSEEFIKKRTTSESSDVFHDETAPNPQVAKQVMNLFKGALDFEKELAVFEKEAENTYPTRTEHITPLKHNGHVTIRTSSSSSDHQEPAKESIPHVKLSPVKVKTSIWTPTPPSVEKVEKTDIKASVQRIKSETEAVSSFDESLDQFYDVLNDLTS